MKWIICGKLKKIDRKLDKRRKKIEQIIREKILCYDELRSTKYFDTLCYISYFQIQNIDPIVQMISILKYDGVSIPVKG
jgi:hypothetical protein